MTICLAAWSALDSERDTASLLIPRGPGAFSAVLIRGPIPWRAIDAWCQRKGLGRSESAILESVIQRLDRERAERETSKLK